MYHPTTRLLTILELLQTHSQMSSEELSRRLEVDPRSIRRYILMLQELGLPIEGTRGPGGGYLLRPGYKLPPLLFTEEEATAIILGLLGTPWLEIDLPAVAIEGALAKVYRVIPSRGRERLQAISSHMLISSQRYEERPDSSLLLHISEAIHEHWPLALAYSSHNNEVSEREIEPYGLVGWRGHWYVVAYCRLRRDMRMFRLDRIQNIRVITETFEPRTDFDYSAHALRILTTVPARWQVEVEFHVPLHKVKQKIPSTYGDFTETSNGVLLEYSYDHLPTAARYLMNLDLPFVIHKPVELRQALKELAEKMLKIASTE